MPRVLHLVGSSVSDFYADLSRLYARDCLEATADLAHQVELAYVSPGGRWRFPDDLGSDAIDAAQPLSLDAAMQRLAALEVDVALPQMFCPPGMTHYRALLEVLGIPYVGNSPDVMALTLHKARARAVVAAAGIAVPEGEVIRPGGHVSVEPPAVVKPVDADNSVGVALVRDAGAYDAALEAAFEHSDEVLVERFVEPGREVRCGIVVRDDEPECLPLEEYDVDAARKPIRDYADKLARDRDGELRLVAKDSRAWIVSEHDPATERVWEAARRCHAALGCRHYSLFDFRLDPDGQPWFLEAGLYCSFARQSVIPTMARAAAIPTAALFGAALENALASESKEEALS